ncbi:hypothetical protein TNIN_286121, partial [Trichonephila inaurata madagascariensis]
MLLVIASDSALSKLYIVQNKALRFITNADIPTLSPLYNSRLKFLFHLKDVHYSALSL